MHAELMDSLEEYLSGALSAARREAVEAHLGGCETCRTSVAGMLEVSSLFGELRCDEAPQPSLGFYAGVMRQVESRRATPSFSTLFGFNLAFGRRVVFASLMTLAVLGGYLVSHEADSFKALSPASVLVDESYMAYDSVPAQDKMLVTLAAYEY